MSQPVIPSRLLFHPDPKARMPYVPSVKTETEGILARWRRSEDNELNYQRQTKEQK